MTSDTDGDHGRNLKRIRAFVNVLIEEATDNRRFAANLAGALESAIATSDGDRPGPAPRGNRRPPGMLDPFEFYERGGEHVLRDELARLDVEQLKDVIAEHGMDRTKLAMKWRTSDRLIALIVETVDARARKGDAFRTTPESPTEGEGTEGRKGNGPG